MKRLLDESTDELTRSLLQAGVDHRPSPDNKRQLIVALGAGGALGLFSSNAFAWLGTTAGKVTAAGVAVGVAGAVFVAGPVLRPSGEAVDRAVASAARDGVAESNTATSLGAEPRAAESAPAAVSPAASAPNALSPEALSPEALPPEALFPQIEGPGSVESPQMGSEREVAAPELAEQDEAPRARDADESRRGSHKASGSRHAKSSRKGRHERRSASAKKEHRAEKVATQAPSAASDARRAALDAEVRLVDEMHAAARRDDRDALARLVAAYRAEFADGQLRKEVADFEARLAPAARSAP